MPNPEWSYQELIWVTMLDLIIAGNCPWNLVPSMAGKTQPISMKNRPLEIWRIKPSEITIEAGANGAVKRYIFTGGTHGKELPLDPSEIINFRVPNPTSYWRGLGAIEPARESTILDFNAIAYNKNFLGNDATPLFYFSSPDKLDDEQKAAHKRAWNQALKGPKKAGGFGYCYGGMEIKTLGLSPKDAQYPQMRKMNREEQLAALGVLPGIVGLLEYANYSNMEVQEKRFWEGSLIPLLTLIADKLTLQFAPLFNENYWFAFDYSDIKALQEDEERKSRIAVSLVTTGIKTPNQVRAEMYGDDPYEGGDQYFMSAMYTPIGTDPAATKKRGQKTVKDEDKPSFWQDKARKKILWENFSRRVDIKRRAFAPQIEAYFKKQAKEIVAKAKKYEDMAHVKPGELFDEHKESEKYATKFEPVYLALVKTAGEAGLDLSQGKLWEPDGRARKLDPQAKQFRVTDEMLQEIRRIVLDSGTMISRGTMEDVLALIDRANEEGLTVEEFTQAAYAKLHDELPIARSRLVARTEMPKVENYGQLEGYKQAEFVELKGWLCSRVPLSRESHIAADEKYGADPIPLNDAFIVGGAEMQYPGDPAGGPENDCNCLCTTFPEVREL
jgi:HK97 family phage portal protein